MNYVLWGFVAVSFAVSYFLGRRLKKYWFLLVAPVLGILVSIPAFLLYARLGNVIEKTGLAFIAVMPVLFLLISFFNTVSSLLGLFLGVFLIKRKNKKINSVA